MVALLWYHTWWLLHTCIPIERQSFPIIDRLTSLGFFTTSTFFDFQKLSYLSYAQPVGSLK